MLPYSHPVPLPLVRIEAPGVAVLTHAVTVQLVLSPRLTMGLLMSTDAPLPSRTAFPNRPPATTAAPLASRPFMAAPPVPPLMTDVPLTLSNV